MATRFASRSLAGPGNGVQTSESADQNTTSMPARKAGAARSRRTDGQTARWRWSMALAVISRTTAMGASTTVARRETWAATGSTTNRPKKPMRRSRAAASSAGSTVVEGGRGMVEGKPDPVPRRREKRPPTPSAGGRTRL